MSESEDSSLNREFNESTASDESTAVAVENQSIMGKMKSRVSGIFPNRISNWFKSTTSTSADNTDDNSLNGSGSSPSSGLANKRSREEMRDDDDDDEEWAGSEDEDGYVNYEEAALADNIAEHDVDDGQAQTHSDYAMNLLRHQTLQKRPGIRARENDGDDVIDINTAEPQNIKSSSLATNSIPLYGKRSSCQPEVKRTRLSNDFSLRDSPMVNRHSFIASTPSVGGSGAGASVRSSSTAIPSSSSASATRTHINRYNYMNLYRNQLKREPAYNFGAATIEAALATSGDLPTTSDSNVNVRNLSSRRNLIIPTSSEQQLQRYNLPNLRRQSLSTVRSTGGGPFFNQTTGILKDLDETPERVAIPGERHVINSDPPNLNININNNNINMKATATPMRVRQNLLNGDSGDVGTSSHLVSLDTASEASFEEHSHHNKDIIGMGNRSRTSSFGNSGINFNAHLQSPKSLFSGRNQPRQGPQPHINNSTMSLNSLNCRRQFNSSVYGSTSALSDSRLYNTMSPFYKGQTTYGGASAYTSYNKILSSNEGGNTDAGSSFLRVKPTVIRPQSSLSTLSSSNASLTTGVGGGITVNPCGITSIAGEQISISNTAQRILTLLNDFSSPLTDARKMADNLKDYRDTLHSKRLKESDLEGSRKKRLAQIRSPYLRPSPHQPGQPGGSKPSINVRKLSSPPPTRELQFPKMTHWLKMKQQMATSSERIRKIAMDEPLNDFFKPSRHYKLPVIRDSGDGDGDNGKEDNDSSVDDDDNNSDSNYEQQEQEQQQNVYQPQQYQPLRQTNRTGKIRQKVSLNARVTSCIDDRRLDETLSPINLPNIAFPHMQSIPIFDIELPKPVDGTLPSRAPVTSINAKNSFVLPSSSLKRVCKTSTESSSSLSSSFKNFKFSPALRLPSPLANNPSIIGSTMKNFKFKGATSIAIANEAASPNNKKTNVNNETKKPTDEGWTCESCGKKYGSLCIKCCVYCMLPRDKNYLTYTPTIPVNKDLSIQEPIEIIAGAPPTTAKTTKNTLPVFSSGQMHFGTAFRKSTSEWECDVCMVRNKESVVKCVACENPRMAIHSGFATGSGLGFVPAYPSGSGLAFAPTPSTSNSIFSSSTNSFGSAFKPKANTWECSTCMIVNGNDADRCIACETQKPGGVFTSDNNKQKMAESVKPKFQFGFGSAASSSSSSSSPVVATDNTFKSLAASQKTSKWSCSACFAQNDAVRKKCICCEEPQPGTLVTPDGGSKFTFGDNSSFYASASQFKFGFSASDSDSSSATTMPPIVVPTTPFSLTATAAANAAKAKAAAAAAGVPVSSVASATGFSFGLAPSTSSIITSGSSDTSDGSTIKPMSGFMFGSGSGSSSSSILNSKFNEIKPTATGTGTVPPATSFKLESIFPTSLSSSSSSFETVVKPTTNTIAPSTSGGFIFNPLSTNSSSTSSTLIIDSLKPVASIDSGFSFTPLGSVASSQSIGATTSSTSVLNSIKPTIVESPVGTGISSEAPAPAIPKIFSFGAFGNAASSSSSANSSSASMGIFATNPVNSSSLSTNILDNPAVPATTTTTTTTSGPTMRSIASTSMTSAAGNVNFQFGQPAQTSTTPSFIFGSQPSVTATSTVAKTTASIFGTTTSTINNSFSTPSSSTFIFGNGESNMIGSSAGATPTNSANKDTLAASTSNIFGSFEGNKTLATTSTFGAPTVLTAASTGTPTSSMLFNAGATVPPSQHTYFSLTACSNAFANNNQNTPVFGGATSKFGPGTQSGNLFGNNSSNNLKTFGMESTSTDGMMQQQQQQQPQQAATFGNFGSGSSLTTPPPQKQKPFGSFGVPTMSAAPSSSNTFGASTMSAAPSSSNTFGASTMSAGPSSSNTFGASTMSAAPSSSNTFGASTMSAAPSSSNTFGASTMSAGPSSSNTFGASAISAGPSSSNTFGNTTEMTKPNSFNFNIPNPSVQSPSTSGIFNFSANSGPTANTSSNIPTLKPAFNFTASNPTVNFNFTGTSMNSSSNNDYLYAANNRPFIFGTPTTNQGMAMGMAYPNPNNIFSTTNHNNNFASNLSSFGANYGMMEASSNAPFQFNAGAAPTANIFAINPTTLGNPGSQTAAQQARRKNRTPSRRVTTPR